jgi:hypothetical protein
MEIKVGEYKVVHSGTIIQIDDLPITVKLRDELEGDYTFIFNFANDIKEKGLTTSANAITTHTMQINMFNFNNAQNAGNINPIDVGTLRKVPLYLSYRVFDLPNTGKTIHFNFYTKQKKDGK